MRICLPVLIAAFLSATPAAAERLQFDHRLSPSLKAAFDANDPALIDFNDKNPRYVTDLVAMRGKSAQDWIEALLIVARTPNKAVRTPGAWRDELQAEAQRRCASTFQLLAEDEVSVTFERRSTGCPSGYAPTAVYRVVAGKRSLFLLGFMARDAVGDQTQREWRAVLASARIE